MPRLSRPYAAVVLLAAGALGTWLLWPAHRPSVLLISIDSLRPDYLSCYGGRHAPTPHIDAVAAAGVTFTQAVADVPWERAAVASLLTGQYASTHRVRSLADRLPDTAATIGAAFAAAGYRTGAVVSNFDVDHIFGLDQGFQTYDDRYTEALHPTGVVRPLHRASIFYGDVAQDRPFRGSKLQADSIRRDAEVTDAAIGWLQRAGAQPFFLWVHYLGPRPHPDAGADQVRAAYQRAVQRVDSEVGRLLGKVNEMGLDRDTIIVVQAERGTSLLDRGPFAPSEDLYDSSLRVPLIIYWGGRLRAGARSDALVRVIDVMPTLSELAGVTPLAPADGRSLVGLLDGREHEGSPDAYFESYLPATAAASQTAPLPDGRVIHFGFVQRGIRTARWKYIRSTPSPLIDVRNTDAVRESLGAIPAREELYDLSHDPGETDNLITRDPTTAATLRDTLARYTQRRSQEGSTTD